jgi:ribosomal protein S18 acetylase RimI-like enzyme
MVAVDYPALRTLWESSEGVGLSDADSPAGFEQFLARNPGLSFVAADGDRLVGGVLCGHDGRRGYIHHLAVSPSHRRRGVARDLVVRCLSGLGAEGIQKCHVFVFGENTVARTFWESASWSPRVELVMFSSPTG